MKMFFGLYMVLLLSVFALWALEPLRAEQEKLAAQVEAEILLQVNELRGKEGRAPLMHEEALSAIAYAHSFDMLSLEYFSHQNKARCNSSCRLTQLPYTPLSSGENMYTTSDYAKDPAAIARAVMEEWMENKERRSNLLSKSFTHIGLGVALSSTKLYATADFVEKRLTE